MEQTMRTAVILVALTLTLAGALTWPRGRAARRVVRFRSGDEAAAFAWLMEHPYVAPPHVLAPLAPVLP
jgi:hypothetical protein